MSTDARSDRVRVGRDRYRQLVAAAETDRERLVVRLAGEVGLTPTEMARIRVDDVETRLQDGRVRHALGVPDGDGGVDRLAPLPADIESALRARTATASSGPAVFDVTPRRLQMLVGGVADRAAEVVAEPSLAEVSSADLRRFFGRDAVERGVPPGAVLTAGGWERLDSIDATVSATDGEAAVAAFSRARGAETTAADSDGGLTGGHGAGEAGGSPVSGPAPGVLRDALDRLDTAVVVLGSEGDVRHVSRPFERLTGRRADGVVGEPFPTLLPDGALPDGFWRTVATEGAWSGALPYRLAQGGSLERPTRATRVPDGAGGAERVVVAVREGGDAAEASSPAESRYRAAARAARDLGDRLTEATTRDGVLSATTAALAENEAYASAWVVEPHPPSGLEPLAAAGIDPSTAAAYAEETDLERDAREVADADDVRAVTVEPASAAPAAPSLLLAPLTHAENCHGVLVLGAPPSAPEAGEREAVSDLGQRVGLALSATEWRHLLLSDSVLELAFESTDRNSLFVDASARLDCRIELDGMVPVEDGLLYYVTVRGAGPEAALSLAEEGGEARLVADRGEASLLEVAAPHASLAAPLIDRGGNVRSLVAEEGRAEIVCEFPPDAGTRDLLDSFLDAFPESTLLSKRENERPGDEAEFRENVDDDLTDKQRSVLRAAYHAGYFEWPRGSTAEELADAMDISSPTLHNHLRRAQQRLLTALFDGEARPVAEEGTGWDS